MSVIDKEPCPGCSTFLIEPFIRCLECKDPKPTICLHCLARGVQFDLHQNDHCYEVIKHDFPVFDKSWKAAEELELVRAVTECGIGNWQDVSNQLRTKTKQECQAHYLKYYIDGAHHDMPQFGTDDYDFIPAPLTVKYSEDPPRPAPNTPWQQDLAGYMPARGDFSTEHDNFAEMDIKDIYFKHSEDDFETEVKLVVLDIFQGRLKERQRRKKIIKDYGLINKRSNQVFYNQYEKNLPFVYRLRTFMRLVPPAEFHKYLELLNHEYELRKSIKSLQELREAGIRQINAGRIYKKMLSRKESEKLKRHSLSDVLNHLQYKDEVACVNWLQRQAALESLSKGVAATLPVPSRRIMAPLEIVHLPGYEKINEKEKELCSSVRLVPEGYLRFKTILEDECKRNGSLKLAQARHLLKIDVNKTRKLFDFLVSEGIINKEPLN